MFTTYRIRTLAVAGVALVASALPAASASAGSGGQLRIEPGWYEGHPVSFLQPSVFSENPNGGVFAASLSTRSVRHPPADCRSTSSSTTPQPGIIATAANRVAARPRARRTRRSGLHRCLDARPARRVHPEQHRPRLRPVHERGRSARRHRAGILVDVTTALTPIPATMVAPVIGGSRGQ